MKLIEFNLSNKYRVQQFIELPHRIYRNNAQWVPPLNIDIDQVFNPRKNPFFEHSTAAFFLVLTDDGSPVGRLAVLNNHNYNHFNHSSTAFFYLFECFNDLQVSSRLFEAAFTWARKQGLTDIMGPRGFTALDGLGLLVKGFEHRPAFGIAYNPDYYQTLVEAAGFEKESDIVSGFLKADTSFPEKIHKVSELVQQRRGLKIVNFQNKKELRRAVPKIKAMYNSSMEGTTGNVPLSEKEVNKIVDQLIWFANPKLVKVIEKDEKLVGYLLAYPDISGAVKKINGQVFPFGWIKLLQEMTRTEWININGAGILEQYQGLGGTAILFSEMYKSVVKGGFKYADLVQIGLDNDKMQRELRELGIDFYKTHRMYRRYL